jgi:hypothetical protein
MFASSAESAFLLRCVGALNARVLHVHQCHIKLAKVLTRGHPYKPYVHAHRGGVTASNVLLSVQH